MEVKSGDQSCELLRKEPPCPKKPVVCEHGREGGRQASAYLQPWEPCPFSETQKSVFPLKHKTFRNRGSSK